MEVLYLQENGILTSIELYIFLEIKYPATPYMNNSFDLTLNNVSDTEVRLIPGESSPKGVHP